MNNDLRWRKWPEEKPGQYYYLVLDEGKVDIACPYKGHWITEEDHQLHKVTHWMPLSALPKPEDTK